MPALLLAAFAVNVKEVLLPIAVIIPRKVPVSSYNISFTTNSVWNKVDVPVTVGDAVEVVIVPVLTIFDEFAIAVIFPSKFPSQAVLDTVLMLKVGEDFLSNTVNGTRAVKHPDPVIPGVAGFATAFRCALT